MFDDQIDLLGQDTIPSAEGVPVLPESDNEKGAVRQLLAYNAYYRRHAWPAPFDQTVQEVVRGDARQLPFADAFAGLVLTHPPYLDLKHYTGEGGDAQIGHLSDYDLFMDYLDRVWRESYRVLLPGGRVCCVIGNVLKKQGSRGRHQLLPVPHEIMVRARRLGFEVLTPILWSKVANRNGNVSRNSAFMGKPYQPNGIVSSNHEYILMLRKPGFRRPSMQAKGLSMLTRDEVASWQQAEWRDIPGADMSGRHPAPFPERIAQRLIRLFSYAGDWVVDPFMGSGTTAVMARETGRNAIGTEVEPSYVRLAQARLSNDDSLMMG